MENERLAKIEGNLEQMGKRLNHVETEIGELRKDINDRFGRMEDRFGRMEDRFGRIENDMKINFRWTVGIMITMWVTIIIAIIFGV